MIGPYFRRTASHVAILTTHGKPHIRFNGRSNTGFGEIKPLWEATVSATTSNGRFDIYGKGTTPMGALRDLLLTTGGR